MLFKFSASSKISLFVFKFSSSNFRWRFFLKPIDLCCCVVVFALTAEYPRLSPLLQRRIFSEEDSALLCEPGFVGKSRLNLGNPERPNDRYLESFSSLLGKQIERMQSVAARSCKLFCGIKLIAFDETKRFRSALEPIKEP